MCIVAKQRARLLIRLIASVLLALPLLAFTYGVIPVPTSSPAPTPTTACGNICQLSTTLGTQGKYAELVASSPIVGISNLSATSLGYECGDPSVGSNGTCWVNDFDGCQIVGQSCPSGPVAANGVGWASEWYGGYNTDRPLLNVIAFSAPGIRKEDGSLLWYGGGHSVTQGGVGGEGSFHFFNAETAAGNINSSTTPTCVSGVAGGPGGCWTIGIPGGRLLPNASGQPSWSQQNDGACGNTSPWITFNKLGTATSNEQSPPEHAYHGSVPIPGTNEWAIGGSEGGCGSSGSQTGNGGGRIVDTSAVTVSMLGTAASTPMFPGAYDPISAAYWAPLDPATGLDANHIYEFSLNPASYTRTTFSSICSQTGDSLHGAVVIFPDPSSPNADADMLTTAMLAYFSNPTAGNADFFLRQHLNGVGGTTADQCTGSFFSGPPGFDSTVWSLAYDDDDGSFITMDESGHLWRTQINFSSLASSTTTQIVSSPTGTPPSCTLSGNDFSGLQYLPGFRSGGGGVGAIEIGCDGLAYITPLTPACTYTGSTNPWSCLPSADTSDTFTTSGDSSAYQFNASGSCSISAADSLVISGGVSTTLCATKAYYCRNTQFDQAAISWQRPGYIDSYQPWATEPVFGSDQQLPSPCNTAEKYFKSNGSAVVNLQQACAGTTSGEVADMPGSIPYWIGDSFFGGCDVTSNNFTMTLDAGVKLYDLFCEGGAGGICLHGTGATLNMAGATVGKTGLASISAIIDVLPNMTNPTIQGASGNYGIIDCASNTGQDYAGQSPHGLFSGASTGLVTAAHLKITNCGNSGTGDIHPIYLSWGGSLTGDTTFCHSINDVLVTDPGGDTPAVKLDDYCGSSADTVTNLSVYCANGTGGCDTTEPIDFQCGGNHLVQHSLFEMFGLSGGNDQWVFSKIAWGAAGVNGCPNTFGPTNSVHFDKDIFIFDGHANYSGGFGSPPRLLVACGDSQNGVGSNCNANASGHTAVCVTNSQIIEDDDDYASLNSLFAGTGVYTDAGCTGIGPDTNTYYKGQTGTGSAGRLQACVAANWSSGSGTNCVFPFVPSYL